MRKRTSRETCLTSILALVLIGGIVGSPATASVYYVDIDAEPGGNGLTWSTAFDDLQAALAVALADDEIWVAEGTYRPAPPDGAREIFFRIPTRVSIYGGFAGMETQREERDWRAHATILSGDLNGDDGPDFENNAENSIHVLRGGSGLLDGFIISGGNANGTEYTGLGGGMYVARLDGVPVIRNCVWRGNTCRELGGAVFVGSRTVPFENCIFEGNVAGLRGGAVTLDEGYATFLNCTFRANRAPTAGALECWRWCSATLTGCSFIDNVAIDAGGAFWTADPDAITMSDCTFIGNRATEGGAVAPTRSTFVRCLFLGNNASRGGAVRAGDDNYLYCTFLGNSANDRGGALYSTGGATTVTNCVFSGNESAGNGGALYKRSGLIRLTQSSLTGNFAGGFGGGLYVEAGDVVATNSILWGNQDVDGNKQTSQLHLAGSVYDVNFCCVERWTGTLGGEGNFKDNPRWIDADGPDDIAGTEDDDLRLQLNSPCIDAANNQAVPLDALDLDNDGDVDEPLPMDSDRLGRFVDVVYVPDNGRGDPPVVDMGAYEQADCNENNVPDREDIHSGVSEDCTGNGIPDECEPDCNLNEQADSCDIAEGIAADCNANDVPDSCDIAEGRSDDDNGNGVPDECELPVIYVNAAAEPGGNGLTWQTAFDDLEDGLVAAGALGRPAEIWVARGTYVPTRRVNENDPRSASFVMVNAVQLLGGFAGHERFRDERNPADNPTVLSGDVERDDGGFFAHRSDNCHIVVVCKSLGRDSRLDGVVIRGGHATARVGPWRPPGSALLIDGGAPTIANCTFADNYSAYDGVVSNAGSAVIRDCEFIGNIGDYTGGAFTSTSGVPILVRCRFSDNRASRGGAVFGGVFDVVGCQFFGNRAETGGAMFSQNAARLTNCLFSGNSATWLLGGGAIYDLSGGSILTQCTFVANRSSSAGGGLLVASGTTRIANSIFWQNEDVTGSGESAQVHATDGSVRLHHCAVQGWTGELGGVGNTGDRPAFVDANGPDNRFGTDDDDLRVASRFAGVDAADNSVLPRDVVDLDGDGSVEEALPLDLTGNPRRHDDPATPDTGNGDAPIVDMGVFETAAQAFWLSTDDLVVDEGGRIGLLVALASDPGGYIEVTISHAGGDGDVRIESGSQLEFNSQNYAVPQELILAADEDPDFLNGFAVFEVRGQGISTRDLLARERDDEVVPARVYVNKRAMGRNTGMSWDDAFTELLDATNASIDRGGISEVWVAAGTYTPGGPGTSREASFRLEPGVQLYGGFAGGETRREDRDPALNETILSGDIEGNDGPNFEGAEENSYHVVVARDCEPNTRLNGFTVTAGNANLPWVTWDSGGGLHGNGGTLIIERCRFVENQATQMGGAVRTYDQDLSIRDCVFLENRAVNAGAVHATRGRLGVADCQFSDNEAVEGGALRVYGAETGVDRCVFSGNRAREGGAVYFTDASFAVRGSTFEHNMATYMGGGVYVTACNGRFDSCRFYENYSLDIGGAMGIWQAGELELERCAFVRNTAEFGGAAFGYDVAVLAVVNCLFANNVAGAERGGALYSHTSHASVSNCTFATNESASIGGGFFLRSGEAAVSNCVFWQNRPDQIGNEGRPLTVDFSLVQGGWPGDGNIDANPAFEDPEGNDYRIAAGSPCIDAADNDAVPDGTETDIDGNPRFVDDPATPDTGVGTPPIVDMGCYEFQVGGCTGREKLKARCTGVPNRGKFKATLTRARLGAHVTFRLYGEPGLDIEKVVRPNGKAKAKFKRVPAGPHAVEILECTVRTEADCP